MKRYANAISVFSIIAVASAFMLVVSAFVPLPSKETSEFVPMVSGLKLGMSPAEVEAIIGVPVESPETGMWTYSDGTIVVFAPGERRQLTFAMGKKGGAANSFVFECPVSRSEFLEKTGNPSETIGHFGSDELVFRTGHGILVASSDKRGMIYLFKLTTKFPLAH